MGRGTPSASRSRDASSIAALGDCEHPSTLYGVFKLANPAKQGDSYFTGNAGGKDTGEVRSGALEGSGVDPARAMVDLMASMRAMEATQKAITTIDSTLQQTASQVGGLPG